MKFLSIFAKFSCLSLLIFSLVYTVFTYGNIYVPRFLLANELTDVQAQFYANNQQMSPSLGKLVLFRRGGKWSLGTVAKLLSDGCYDIVSIDNGVTVHHVAQSSIRTLSALWNYIFQPEISLDAMKKLLDARNDYYRKNGAPDGHGMIFPAQSKIIVLGAIEGDFQSLQNHFMQMYKDGLINEQFKLKANCYVICLGNYTGGIGQSIAVLYTLLKLQENNPGRVFLLRGAHEDAAMAQMSGFQKEWYGTFGKTQKDFHLSELVWLKMLMLWKSLPKVLLAGLQMPSTQHYDFIMFCHAQPDISWRPEALMRNVVEKHIAQLYKSPCVIDYRDDKSGDVTFCRGAFDGDDTLQKNAGIGSRETVWNKSVFEQFVKQHGLCIDKKRMYESCLCALVRGSGHIPGGIVAYKKNGWKPLRDGKIYEINPYSVYSCTSGARCMSKAGCFDGAFGIIEAAATGHWHIVSHLEI